jgi:hypothetical protein
MSAGGMQSKLNAMRLMADFGIPCCIANGKTPEGIVEILEGNESKIGTTLTLAGRKGISPVLTWMATGAEPEGTLIVSGLGAASIQRDDLHRGSILSIGVEAVLGDFPGGAIVAVRDESAKFLGVGRVRISADKLRHDLWKAEDKDVVRREHFLPLRQGRSFVNERTSLRRYVSNYAETYDFFVNKKNAYISMWKRSEPQGFRLELRGPAVNAVLARAERMTQELQIRRDDWLLYELASYYLQSAKATPKIDPPKA